MNKNQRFVITIGRERGSGGRMVGKELARRFHIHYYDREILACASKELNVDEAYLASNGAWMRHDGFPWKVDCWMPMPDRRPPEGEV